MVSLEFGQRLQQARAFRQDEAAALRSARTNSLRDDAKEYLGVLHQDPQYQQAKELTLFDRWEHLAAKTPEFSDEDWERTGKMLSGINNGVKAALFIDIAQNSAPGTYMPINDIADHFKELFAGTQLLAALGRTHTKKQIISYCQESLCDVGLLTAEYNLAGKLIGFGVTEEGLTSGLPHAWRVLQWENNMQESIYPILGFTRSNGVTRAPFKTSRVLEYIFRHPYNTRAIDLGEIVIGTLIDEASILKRLQVSNLIKYKAVTLSIPEKSLKHKMDFCKE